MFLYQETGENIGYQIWWHNDGFSRQWGITGPGLKSAVNEGHHSARAWWTGIHSWAVIKGWVPPKGGDISSGSW